MNLYSAKKYRSSKNSYLRTVPNCLNVHHVNHPKSEKHRLDPQLSKNEKSPISNKTPQSSSTNYERLIANTAEIKFTNNRYTTPLTVELGSFESENSINLLVKHQKIFIAIKLLDPSASITIKDKVITNPQEFPVGTEYTKYFDVITDKKTKFPVSSSTTIYTPH